MKEYLKAGAGLAAALCMMWGCSSEIPSAVLPPPATYQSALSLNPLLYTTLDNVAAVMTPAFGTGQGATIATVPANDFKPALIGNGLLANKAGERVRYPQTNGGVQNIELEHGTMDFWYKPNYNHDNNTKYTIAGTGNFGASRHGSMHLGKHNSSNQSQLFLIFHDANSVRYEHNVAKASYYWRAGNWLQMRITWDFNVPAGVQNLHLYLNGAELPLTGQVSRGPQILPAERSTELIYIGARDVAGGVLANGLHDEFRIWDQVIPPTPPAVASVSLSAPDSSLTVGDPAVQATVVARDAANNILSLTGRTVVWTSSATGVATVSASGLVTPVSAGSTTIGVTVDGVGPATFALTVAAAPVASVSVTAPDSSIDVGTAVQATVVARDAANNILPLTGRAVVWTSSAAGVATVTASGLVDAVGAGSATIEVTVDGVGPASFTLTVAPAAVASVSVTAPDSSLTEGDPAVQATVVARDAANNILSLTGRTVVWTSSATGVATVSASGLVTPVSAGSTTIGVTVDGVGPATFTLTVATAPVASVSVTAPDSSIAVGTAVQATVVARDAANNILPLTGRAVVWTSSDAGVATVAASGLVDAVGAGSATIEVTVDGVGPASFTLTVAPAAVASVSVTAPDSSLTEGDPAVQATVVARDAANNILSLTGRSIVWTSSDAGVATVAASGLVDAVGAGSAIIGVTVDGVGPASFTLTVAPAGVASVSVTAPDSSLSVGDPAVQATVVARDAANNILSLTGRTVVWTSSDAGVATVGASGLVDAVGEGSATIEVTVDGVGPATFTLTVVPAPAASMSVTLPTRALPQAQRSMVRVLPVARLSHGVRRRAQRRARGAAAAHIGKYARDATCTRSGRWRCRERVKKFATS